MNSSTSYRQASSCRIAAAQDNRCPTIRINLCAIHDANLWKLLSSATSSFWRRLQRHRDRVLQITRLACARGKSSGEQIALNELMHSPVSRLLRKSVRAAADSFKLADNYVDTDRQKRTPLKAQLRKANVWNGGDTLLPGMFGYGSFH